MGFYSDLQDLMKNLGFYSDSEHFYEDIHVYGFYSGFAGFYDDL